MHQEEQGGDRPVESQGYLWLVCVELMRCHACHCLNVACFNMQHLLVEGQAGVCIIEGILYPGFPKQWQWIVCTPLTDCALMPTVLMTIKSSARTAWTLVVEAMDAHRHTWIGLCHLLEHTCC